MPITRSSATSIGLRIWLGLFRSVLGIVRGPADLAIRLFLAQAFVVTSVMAMASGHGGAGGMMSAGAMVAGSGLAGLLFSLGLFTRLAAGALLSFAIAQQWGLEASEPNLFIIALLGWYGVHGPGAVSIDRALALGIRASALPLAQPVMRGLDAMRRRAAPAYLLLARLWLAAAITGAAGDSRWVPGATFAAVPVWLKLAIAALHLFEVSAAIDLASAEAL